MAALSVDPNTLAVCATHAVYYDSFPMCHGGHMYCPHCEKTVETLPPEAIKTCTDCKLEACQQCAVYTAMKPVCHSDKYRCPPCETKTPKVLSLGYIKNTTCPTPDGCGMPLQMCGTGALYCVDCMPSKVCKSCALVYCMQCDIVMTKIHNYTREDVWNGEIEEYICGPCKYKAVV